MCKVLFHSHSEKRDKIPGPRVFASGKGFLRKRLLGAPPQNCGGVSGIELDVLESRRQAGADMATIPTEFRGVTAVTRANVYFDGKVVSHSLLFADGSKKTLGLIYPGKYHFGTDQGERMEIVAGQCEVKLDGQSGLQTWAAGQSFEVPGKSGFDIAVESGICQYICSYLTE
jgi:uncharacterized protein YaiE (UPF0345 family)